MFSNSRNRFAAIIVINFIIILGATLFIIYFTTYSKMIEEDKQMLSTFASFYDLNGLPDNNSTNGLPSDLEDEKLPEGIDTSVSSQSRFQTSTFYAVVFDTDLNVIESMNDNPVQYTDDDLISMANTYLSGNKSFGLAQNLAYMITKGDDYILVTMMDTTAVSSAIASLFKYMIIFGAIAIVVLLLTSTLLASWVMQPLKMGYEKQKRFVSDAGHELKTPISTINANTELLQREIGENKWLKNIIYENDRMNEIVHQLLDLAKLEQTRPIMTEVDLSRLCMACTLPFEAAAFESEILFSYDIKDGIVVKGEASSLEKLISILIDNAISHSEKGTEVILKLEEHLGKAQFTISNSSDEISDEDLSNMFERFYKSDKSRSFTSHYGLGLSIAKSITNLHGGEISVSYSSGRIIFTVIL